MGISLVVVGAFCFGIGFVVGAAFVQWNPKAAKNPWTEQ